MRKVINLTGKDVFVYDDKGNFIKVYPSEGKADVKVVNSVLYKIDGVEVYSNDEYLESGLPDIEEGVLYLVTHKVRLVIHDRDDLLVPIKEAYSMEEGQSIVCQAFLV